jgi:hypothetical protein
MQMYQQSKPQFLEQLVKKNKLTADGKDWLVSALDPFHDYNHQLAGYPDADASQTLVSCFQYQADVSCPAGVNGNWDAHVFTLPICNTQGFDRINIDETGSQCQIAGALFDAGPLNICAGNPGAPIGFGPNLSNTCLPRVFTPDLSAGNSRVIAMAYEVTNTTAEMHKQGSVTSYRMPQYPSAPGNIILTTGNETLTGSMCCIGYRAPPASVAEINLLKGSRTWDAASGVYSVCAQSSVQNPIVSAGSTGWVYKKYSVPGQVTDGLISAPMWAAAHAVHPNATPVAAAETKSMPFDISGSYFSGLSHETTLTVKLRVYVERAPMFDTPSLSVLASPSAGYDTTALELYAQAISQLPVAVTVAENGLGDWFRGVIRVLKSAVGTATDVVGPFVPGANQMGIAAQKMLGRIDGFFKKPSSVITAIRPKAKKQKPKQKK